MSDRRRLPAAATGDSEGWRPATKVQIETCELWSREWPVAAKAFNRFNHVAFSGPIGNQCSVLIRPILFSVHFARRSTG